MRSPEELTEIREKGKFMLDSVAEYAKHNGYASLEDQLLQNADLAEVGIEQAICTMAAYLFIVEGVQPEGGWK